jgi:hypothetical protein
VNKFLKDPPDQTQQDLRHPYDAVEWSRWNLLFEEVMTCTPHTQPTIQCTLDIDSHCSMQQGIVPDSLQCMLQELEKQVASCHLRKSSRLHHDQWQQVDEEAPSWLDGRVNTAH